MSPAQRLDPDLERKILKQSYSGFGFRDGTTSQRAVNLLGAEIKELRRDKLFIIRSVQTWLQDIHSKLEQQLPVKSEAEVE
ncbi:MAG: hypothetical protein AAF581_10970 [Planctomycetota bacterium]